MTKKPVEPFREQAVERRDALVIARDEVKANLAGLENQIYVLNNLLNPPIHEAPAEESAEPPATGVDSGPGNMP